MPTAWGYVRVSHNDTLQQGDAIAAQKQRIEWYYNGVLKDQGVKFGQIIEEKTAISASKFGLFQRPGGKELLARMQSGDHVVFDKIDRLWRDMRDCVRIMEYFKAHNITFHICNMGGGGSLVSGTLYGDFFLKMCVLFAELEAHQVSERTKAQKRYARSMGYRISNHIQPGTRVRLIPVSGRKPLQKLEWDYPLLKVMGECIGIFEKTRNIRYVFSRMERWFAARENRMPRNIAWAKFERYRSFLHYAVYYREMCITDPSQIPPKAVVDAFFKKWQAGLPRKGYVQYRPTLDPYSLASAFKMQEEEEAAQAATEQSATNAIGEPPASE